MVEDNVALRAQLEEVQRELRIAKARLAELEPQTSDEILPSKLPSDLPSFHTVEERRHKQEALRASEERYRSIVEDQSELVCRYDRDCRLTYVNKAYAELYEKRPEELLGTSFLDLIPADAREAAQAYVWGIRAHAPVIPFEHISILPDGSQRWYQWTDRALENENDEIVEYQGVGRDITERKQAEAELAHDIQNLEEMRHLLQTALDAFPANAAILDPTGKIIAVNAPWLNFANDNGSITPAGYLGDNYLSICDNSLAGESNEATFAATGIRAVIAGRKDEFYLEYACHSQTKERWYMLRVLPFAEPIPRRVLVAHIDITEQEKAERAEHEQRLIAETLRDSLAMLTSSLNFETVMQLILAYSANIIPSDAGAIILFEGNQGRVAYTRGFSAEAEAYYQHNMISLDSGTFTKERLNLKTYLAADTKFTPNWIVYPFAEWIQSSIGVPIVMGGKSVGLLTADSKTPNHFQHKDVENLLAFASYAALALENAHNYDQLEQRVSERTAELQAAKERVEAILNNSADGIMLVDCNFTIQQTNVAFHRLFACTPEECHNQPLLWLLAQKDDDFIIKTFQAGVAENQATHIELRARRHDGTEFDAELSIGAMKGGGWVCNIRNITERKKAEERLQKSAREIHDLYNNAPCGYHSIDKDGVIVQINDTELSWLGYRYDELVGKAKFSELLTPESGLLFQQNFPIFKSRGWENDLEFDVIRKDGSIMNILLNGLAIHDEKGEYIQSRTSVFDITELKRAQQALAQSELRYRLLAENVTDVIAKMSLEGVCTFVTPSSYTLLGYLPEEIVGHRAANLLHPDDIAHTKQILRDSATSQSSSFLLIQRLRHKSGHYVWIEVKGSIVRAPITGQALEFIGVFRDISERKRTEEMLNASLQQERELQNYLKALHEITIELTQINELDTFYKRAIELGLERLGFERLALFLYDPEDGSAQGTYGTDAQGKLSEEHHLRFVPDPQHSFLRAFSATERLFIDEKVILYADAKPVGFGWYAGSTLSNGAQNLGWLVTDNLLSQTPHSKLRLNILGLYGLTVGALLARKQVQIALQENEEKYRHLVETMQGGLAIYDLDGKVTYVNDRAGEILGYSRHEIIGSHISNFMDRDTVEIQKLHFFQKNREGASCEIVARHKSEKAVHLLISGSPLVDKNGNYSGSFVVMTDISTQKEAEESLRQGLAKEKELGELKTRFVSMASHEFRTPLATILATTETLSAYRHKMTDEQIAKRLHNIFEQIGHLKNIMEDMLQLARIQARRVEFNPVLLNLDALCRSVIDEFHEGAAVSPRLRYTCEDSTRENLLDKKLMRQILSNLISNALKYSNDETDVQLSLAYQQDQLILTVSDNGVGIPEADKKHLFEPFHRGVNVGTVPGTGLGLTIVKEAVDLHNGEIQLTSEEDWGTSVVVRIPVKA